MPIFHTITVYEFDIEYNSYDITPIFRDDGGLTVITNYQNDKRHDIQHYWTRDGTCHRRIY
jgi:hypothetical protein